MATAKAATPKWLSVTQLAEARGVGKSAISRRVARMEANGLIDVRLENGSKLVNVADFERACLISTDAVRERNGSASKGKRSKGEQDSGDAPSLASQQSRRTSIQADLAQLVLDQRRGVLLRREDVEAATRRAGEIIVKKLEALPMYADDIVKIALGEGVPGTRLYLKQCVTEIRDKLADAMNAFSKSGS